MPTSEEVQDWLAHYIQDDELAHFGVLGMRWGVRKARTQVQKDAKKDAVAFLRSQNKDNTEYYHRHLIQAQITRRSKNPKYVEAFEKAKRQETIKSRVTTGVVLAGVAAYTAYSYRNELKYLAYKASENMPKFTRGAKAAAPILKELGHFPILNLVKGADGVFRLPV